MLGLSNMKKGKKAKGGSRDFSQVYEHKFLKIPNKKY